MKIESIKCEVVDIWSATIATEIKLSGKENINMYLVEVDGNPVFYSTKKDIFDILIDNKYTDENVELLDKITINEYNGIDLSDYDTIIETIDNAKDEESKKLIRLLVAVTRSDNAITKSLIENN